VRSPTIEISLDGTLVKTFVNSLNNNVGIVASLIDVIAVVYDMILRQIEIKEIPHRSPTLGPV